MITRTMIILTLVATIANADPMGFVTTNRDYGAKLVDYFDTSISTNHPVDYDDYPWSFTDDGHGVFSGTWKGDPSDNPTLSQFNAGDALRGEAIRRTTAKVIEYARNGWSIAVQNNAASNIVALAASYGVTNQPVPWADVAAAMQAERADATASNDVMRVLNVVGDGTTMLSYKEFYSENGGDIFNVVTP
jgi:hypothetical protein